MSPAASVMVTLSCTRIHSGGTISASEHDADDDGDKQPRILPQKLETASARR